MSTIASLLMLFRALGRDEDVRAVVRIERGSTRWQDCLFFVKPDTVVRWHRRGWRYYWRRKSKPKTQGRPPISFAVIYLIKRMSRENVTWCAPRIARDTRHFPETLPNPCADLLRR